MSTVTSPPQPTLACLCEIECHLADLNAIAKAKNAPAILSKGKFRVVACKKCYKEHIPADVPVEIKNAATWESFLSTGLPLIYVKHVEVELARA